MVLEGQVDGPVLSVQLSLIRVFSKNSLLLRGRRPCWNVCRADSVGREDKGGSGYACILFGLEDESEVAVLASYNVALDGRRVFRQELMFLLDGGVVRISGVWEE